MSEYSRRQWLQLAVGGCLAQAAAPAGMQTASERRPNVLFIAVDDLRPKLGCYGDAHAKTPNIDRLASRGLVFERAYCQQAVCGPSRASLLTGLRPDTIRVYDLQTSFRDAVPDAVTLPEYFKDHGYHAQSIGKIFHGNEIMLDRRSWSAPEQFPILLKRDQYVLERNKDAQDPWKKTSATERVDVPDDAYRDGQIAEAAVEALGHLKDRPFFLAVGFNKPHLPFAAPSRYWDLFDRRELPLPDNQYLAEDASRYALQSYSELRSYDDFPDDGPMPEAKAREAIHGYYAATSYIDAQVGKVLNHLERLKLDRNTVVVLWGDHGWHLGEQAYWGKTTNFEVCVRAPLILRLPQHGKGSRTPALVEFVDIYPTLVAACGLPEPKGLEGTSLMPLANNPGTRWKKAAFSQYPRRGSGPAQNDVMGYSMRTDRYRYTTWVRPDGQSDAIELYDHQRDPNETRNVAQQPEYQKVIPQMARIMSGGWKGALPSAVRK